MESQVWAYWSNADTHDFIVKNAGAAINNVDCPNLCPRCYTHIQPVQEFASLKSNQDSVVKFVVLWWCPCCEEYFAQFGNSYYDQAKQEFCVYQETECFPNTFVPKEFSDTIKGISPGFIKIHGQAQQSEWMKLDEIAGVGYRKALEFLIKDYAIINNQNPADQDNIKKIQLKPCLDKYITDPRIQGLAERAAWLGNDQTHYVKKHTDKDVEDLKCLIDLTIHWIEMEERTKKALQITSKN